MKRGKLGGVLAGSRLFAGVSIGSWRMAQGDVAKVAAHEHGAGNLAADRVGNVAYRAGWRELEFCKENPEFFGGLWVIGKQIGQARFPLASLSRSSALQFIRRRRNE